MINNIDIGNCIIRYCIVLIIITNTSSCKKFLDKKSSTSILELKTLDHLQAMLDYDPAINTKVTPALGEASADDYFLTSDLYASFGDSYARAYTWHFTDRDNNYPGDWSFCYQGIYVANYVLDHLLEIKLTPANEVQYNNIKGSAHFIKSYFYLNLIWEYGPAFNTNSYGDLGIVLRKNSDPSVKSTRSSVKDAYDEIINQARQAADLLGNTPRIVLRPSKPAAYGLLARAFWSIREYDSAYKYADLCLKIKGELLDFKDGSINLDGMPMFGDYNKEVIFYTSESSQLPITNPFIGLVDTILYHSYADNDLRKRAFFFDNNGYHGFKGTYSQFGPDHLFSGIAVDEILLIRAESSVKKTVVNLKEGLADLNNLLSNRYDNTFMPVETNSVDEAISLIQNERRKELLMRGLRWIDIKRLNQENNNIDLIRRTPDGDFTLKANDKRFALPLPADIIEITGMPSN